jgi:hypothetical protein
MKQKKRRITGLYLLAPTGRGYEKPQPALRAFVRFFSGTFCPPLKPLRGFFIGRKKTSDTAGTLCAMAAKIYYK